MKPRRPWDLLDDALAVAVLVFVFVAVALIA